MILRKIFRWFGSFFHSGERYDVYKVHERMVYVYFDGQKEVHADPMVLYKKMMSLGPELSADMKGATSASKRAGEFHNGMIAKIRKIFDVLPLAEGGLSELETVELLDHFIVYCEWVKKNSRVSQTASVPSEASQTISEIGVPPISPSSDSGSIASDPSTDKPPLSTSEPEPPSA